MNNQLVSLILGSGILVWGFRIGFYLLQVIALWKVFQKTGEPGWKSLIPFYNDYVLCRKVWSNKNMADLFLLSLVIGEAIGDYTLYMNELQGKMHGVLLSVSLLLLICAGVLVIRKNFKESKAFGHGTGFAIGLTLLGPIFHLILGFGPSKYLGPQD